MANIKQIIIEEKINRSTFLIQDVEELILIDSGAKHHTPILLEELNKIINIKDINTIILQSNDFLNITSLETLVSNGFNGTVIVNETGYPHLDLSLNIKFKTIEEIDFKFPLQSGEVLEFITTPFLPFPECFVTYMTKHQVLFSGHLFSHVLLEEYPSQEKLINAIDSFHESILPSVEFIRHSLLKLKNYKILGIYPRIGNYIRDLNIPKIFETSASYDFYNTKQVVLKKNKKNVSYNFEAILNHMLKLLETRYHRNEIYQVFKDSEIKIIEFSSLDIDKTYLKGYKLWNYFFDRVFDSKGIYWLALLEPLVRKYHRTYNINLPSIYTSKIIQQAKEIQSLNESNTVLGEELYNLQLKVNETADQLLKCPITNLYNQNFMQEHLVNNLDKPIVINEKRALIAVQVDNLVKINKKYGSIKGDETLRNLTYILNKTKSEFSMLFKQNGPGIFVYKQSATEEEINTFFSRVNKQIAENDIFVEPITVSMAVVKTDELNSNYTTKGRVNQLFELTLSRLERAKQKGYGQILNQESDTDVYVEGKILLVDEDETYQNLMIKIFKRINYDVVIAKDIYEAFDIIDDQKIDCIISEINLSKLDGFRFKQKLNDNPTQKNIPFIIASHHKNLDAVIRANLIDVDLILKKPIVPEEIIGHIKRIKDKQVRL
jgi:diguanylate cyclase (GGDEF)-like protein